MTKFEEMVNDYYATEGLTLDQHVEITMDLPKEEAIEEFKYLLQKI